jgi:hypothetical protein
MQGAQQPCHIPEVKNRRLWSRWLFQPNLINTPMSRCLDIRDRDNPESPAASEPFLFFMLQNGTCLLTL